MKEVVNTTCAISFASFDRPSLSGASGKTESRRLEIRPDSVDGQQCLMCPAVPC